ncbi:SDR family NAD(P)-dependent oxidoreductase [Streptomyces sp. bgisy027]|uniref:SDR family NAD(P)-dependent oxidoreductase n=1 Tax=unclassified Streptomyces TaxID=2593676 RepID=UPI003D714D88
MRQGLRDKVVLITGTGGGMGREAALRFAAAGAIVVGCDVDEEANKQTLSEVEAAGGVMDGQAPVDLGDSAQATAWVERAAREHGRIDVVYNNASTARFAPVASMSDEDWRFTLRNELDLVFYVTRAAWPHLAERGGVIINIASVAAHRGNRQVPILAHSATKGGVVAMTRQLAAEGAPHGIRAVSISPGTIETPGTAATLADPAVQAGLLSQTLTARLGVPTDVVSLALHLAGDEAGFLTGIDFLVDGGMTAF